MEMSSDLDMRLLEELCTLNTENKTPSALHSRSAAVRKKIMATLVEDLYASDRELCCKNHPPTCMDILRIMHERCYNALLRAGATASKQRKDYPLHDPNMELDPRHLEQRMDVAKCHVVLQKVRHLQRDAFEIYHMSFYMTGHLYRMWDASEVVSCYEAVAEDWLKRISLGGRVLSPDEGCTSNIRTMMKRGKYLDTYVLSVLASMATKLFFKEHMGTGYWCDVKENGRPGLLYQADVTSALAVNTQRQLLQTTGEIAASSAQQAAPTTCLAARVATEHVALSAVAPALPVECLQLGCPIYDGWAHVVVVTYPREYIDNEVVPRTAELAAKKLGVEQDAIGIWWGFDAKNDFDEIIGGYEAYNMALRKKILPSFLRHSSARCLIVLEACTRFVDNLDPTRVPVLQELTLPRRTQPDLPPAVVWLGWNGNTQGNGKKNKSPWNKQHYKKKLVHVPPPRSCTNVFSIHKDAVEHVIAKLEADRPIDAWDTYLPSKFLDFAWSSQSLAGSGGTSAGWTRTSQHGYPWLPQDVDWEEVHIQSNVHLTSGIENHFMEVRESLYGASAKRQRLTENLSDDMDQSTSTDQDDGLLT